MAGAVGSSSMAGIVGGEATEVMALGPDLVVELARASQHGRLRKQKAMESQV